MARFNGCTRRSCVVSLVLNFAQLVTIFSPKDEISVLGTDLHRLGARREKRKGKKGLVHYSFSVRTPGALQMFFLGKRVVPTKQCGSTISIGYMS